MPARVTERWSEREWEPGKSATRAWDVDQVDDEGEALAAVGLAADDTFPVDDRLGLDTVKVTRTGPRCFREVATYKFSQSGDPPPLSDNPLDRPVEWLWDEGTTSEPTDVDADGLALSNAGGFPFAGGQTVELPYDVITGTRYEARYDVAKNHAYRGRVNQDSVHLPMTDGDYEPGQLLLVSYKPLAPYTIRSKYLQVRYTLWGRKGSVQDADGLWDAWKWRLLNVSNQGWWDDSGTKRPGAFVYKRNRERVAEPVLIDDTGKPINAGFEVEAGPGVTAAAVAAPNAVSSVLLEHAGSVWFMKFRKRKKVAYSGLTLF